MSDGFLSRWSRRKLEAKTSEAEVKARPIQESHDDIGLHGFVPQAAGADVQSTQVPQAQPQAVPVPTEEDLEAVKAGGDIRAFLSGQVSGI